MDENITDLQIKPKITDTRRLLMNMFSYFKESKDILNVVDHLTGFIAANYPDSKIIKLKDSIKIVQQKESLFTVIQLFFDKVKINLRYNTKSYDHLIMSEPNQEFVNAIIKEIKVIGYHQFRKENDDLHSTCRMEFIKGK